MGAISAAKGVSQISNSSPMAGPEQIMDAADDLARLIDESVPTIADLPAAGSLSLNDAPNWIGRSVTVAATGSVYRWHGAGWYAVNGACRLRTESTQATSGTALTPVAVSWTKEDFDTGEFHSGNSSRMIATVPGIYGLRGKLRYSSTAFPGGVMLGKNGVAQLDTQVISGVTSVAGSYAESSSMFQLAAGDYLEVFSIGAASSLSLSIDRCFAEMWRVG